MYGVPEQLDLSPFIGATLDYIGLGKFQIYFDFCKDSTKLGITAEGYWELRDAETVLIDKSLTNDERVAYQVHRLLSRAVSATKVNPPKSFALVFDNDWTLTIVDDSTQYESCHIRIGDREIYI